MTSFFCVSSNLYLRQTVSLYNCHLSRVHAPQTLCLMRHTHPRSVKPRILSRQPPWMRSWNKLAVLSLVALSHMLLPSDDTFFIPWGHPPLFVPKYQGVLDWTDMNMNNNARTGVCGGLRRWKDGCGVLEFLYFSVCVLLCLPFVFFFRWGEGGVEGNMESCSVYLFWWQVPSLTQYFLIQCMFDWYPCSCELALDIRFVSKPKRYVLRVLKDDFVCEQCAVAWMMVFTRTQC